MKVWICVSLLIGALLRLVWIEDMEYKWDEATMWETARSSADSGQWPLLGMPSGVGLRNPGISVWVFIVLKKIFFMSEPTQMAIAVGLSFVLALAGLFFLVRRYVPSEEREPWLWAIAILCVNPVFLQLSRKIWAQSLLPFFLVLFLWAWWERRTWVGAFFAGLLGLAMGQIHMSGFFFFPGFVGWQLLFGDRRGIRWYGLGVGMFVGLLGMIPWIGYFLSRGEGSGGMRLSNLLSPKFFQHWILFPFGIHLGPNLGSGRFWEQNREFMAFSPGVVLAYGMMGFAFLLTLIALFRKRRGSFTNLQIGSALWGYGGLITLAGVWVHRHYLEIVFPFLQIWACRLLLGLRRGNAILVALWIAQLVLSAEFLRFIHVNRGAPQGDYGVSYRAQSPIFRGDVLR